MKFTLLITFVLLSQGAQASTIGKILKCTKTEKAGRLVFEKIYTQSIENDNALIQKTSEIDDSLVYVGYVSNEFKMIGVHINDNANASSSGSYADYTKEKPFAKLNYKKSVKIQGEGLFVFECEIVK
jgi:hypothetical protein